MRKKEKNEGEREKKREKLRGINLRSLLHIFDIFYLMFSI